MVVDRLEVLRFDPVRPHPVVAVELDGDVAHHVLDELRIVVGALGNVFLVRALEQAVQFAGGLRLDGLDQLLQPERPAQGDPDRDVRALVVGAVVRDALGAGAEAGDRDDHGGAQPRRAAVPAAGQAHLVVEVALHAGDRRGLAHEEREGHLDAALVGAQAAGHLPQQLGEIVHGQDLLLAVQHVHEARHVRALDVRRQVHGHGQLRHRRLGRAAAVREADRVQDVLDADLVDRDRARVGAALLVVQAVGRRQGGGLGHWNVSGNGGSYSTPLSAMSFSSQFIDSPGALIGRPGKVKRCSSSISRMRQGRLLPQRHSTRFTSSELAPRAKLG